MIRHLAPVLLAAASLLAPALSQAQADPGSSSPPTQVFPTTPISKPGGAKWRIAYVESGDYADYPLTLGEIADGLQSLGWLRFTSERPEGLAGRELWNWLAANTESAQLQFKADAYWQPGNFDASQREPMRAAIAQRIKEKADIDLIIAMGTWAGQDMRTLGPPVPTIVGSTSDPVAAGIADSAQDSGRDLLHARVEPERYQRQLRLFHEIVPFKTLGIVYEDSVAGRTYAGISAVQQVSQELGFTITSCHAPSSSISAVAANANAVRCYQKLADEHVDAIYVTSHRGVNSQSLPEIAQALKQAKIPSFSMAGSKEVELGILLSLARADISYVGLFHAETMARIFNGAKPRQLSQIWIDPPKIALNLSTARIIGFDPPVDILLAADEVYEGK
ncbi:ABC transporter substrate binding protein [Pollutimonas bauzanensis]|uniref:ABC transporter substrate-binding protein n=1 Tax=Pollutimonas bauzanensis TaxID=658167 RepID=UPI00333ECCAA